MNTITRTVARPVPVQPPQSCEGTEEGCSGDTMRDLLRECIGDYIITEHLVGTSGLVTQEGRLIRVGSNSFVLLDESTGTQTACDYYSLKFFHRLTPENEPHPHHGAVAQGSRRPLETRR